MSKIVVFDVDMTVGCGDGETCGCGPRPGIPLTLRVLSALGFTAHLWSAAGAEHAQRVAENTGISQWIATCRTKPDAPMTAKDAVAMFGRVPDLTVDDEAFEALPGVPCVIVDQWFGAHA